MGFEEAGFRIAHAFDIRPESIESYNFNRPHAARGIPADVRLLTVGAIDKLHGSQFRPSGIIGGPPCQSFSKANHFPAADDPRHNLPFVYSDLIAAFNKRHPVPFFVFENVPGLLDKRHIGKLDAIVAKLSEAGFAVSVQKLNALHYGVPQNRERLIIVGLNKHLFGGRAWQVPARQVQDPARLTVGYAFRGLPEPVFFDRKLTPETIPFHPNHWCMQPKSHKFATLGALAPGRSGPRSFKTLSYDAPSITVSYGNREVHIHPSCRRRLSVLEAMRLQGFPDSYILRGFLSAQITQISEAVPPPLARAVAESIIQQTGMHDRAESS